MGCDIHIYLEKQNRNNKWCSFDYYKKSNYSKEFVVIPIYDDRNYTLFSILANVRNSGGNKPISEPKGLPDDCCKEILLEYQEWQDDAHSCSYLTLKELKDYKKENSKTRFSGLLSPKQQNDLDNGILPNSWCQGTNMEGYKRREWEDNMIELDPIINKIEERLIDEHCIYYKSDEDKQNKLKEYEEKVRIVFWFDN